MKKTIRKTKEDKARPRKCRWKETNLYYLPLLYFTGKYLVVIGRRLFDLYKQPECSVDCCLELCLSLNEAKDEAAGMDFKKTGKVQLSYDVTIESSKVGDAVQNVNVVEEEEENIPEKKPEKNWLPTVSKFRKEKNILDGVDTEKLTEKEEKEIGSEESIEEKKPKMNWLPMVSKFRKRKNTPNDDVIENINVAYSTDQVDEVGSTSDETKLN